jgi:hypothetical protein
MRATTFDDRRRRTFYLITVAALAAAAGVLGLALWRSFGAPRAPGSAAHPESRAATGGALAGSPGEPSEPAPGNERRGAAATASLPRSHQSNSPRGADQVPRFVGGAPTFEPEAVGTTDRTDAAAVPLHFATDKDGIRAAISSVKPQLKACYESWLKANPDLGGKITVEFLVTPSPGNSSEGKASDIKIVDNSMAAPWVEGCAFPAIDGLHFQAPRTPVKVRYPLVLLPGPPPSTPAAPGP